MLFAVILILSLNLAFLLGGVYAYKKANRAANEVKDTLFDIFKPQPEGKASHFGQIVDQIAEIIASHTGSSVQASIRGAMGGTMRGINSALEQEAIEANPQLAIAEMLPKSLKRNPLAVAGLQQIVGNILQASTRGGYKSGSNNGPPKFNL